MGALPIVASKIEDIQAAYPLLDMIDKDRRYRNVC